ncbi:lipase family protein [Burkholderia perseverans]|uniref:lipase family protein n=1 Tax=Burkholderia perseverans TaxID=2615214 RepID=UPI001FF07338|nr:lipase family protein [Burkholderia perseverans]
MTKDPAVENDVYERYGLKWADFPHLITPSAHSDEAELFCAKQSLAVYAAYPNSPHAPGQDYIPCRQRNAIASRTLAIERMIEGGADGQSRSFDAERGYRVVVTDQASALLTWKNDHLVIAFRGTANWQDWIHNFTGGTIDMEAAFSSHGAQLHKGFTGLAENLAPAILELIIEFLQYRESNEPAPPLTLCGHSLGGALALNFAAWLHRHAKYNHWPNARRADRHDFRLGATYTFGAPRIGKGEIWQYIHRPHYRLIVQGDPVPSTPPGFASDFQATYLSKPGGSVQQSGNSVRKLLKGAWTSLKPNLDFGAHDIESYIDAIGSKIEEKKKPTVAPPNRER